MNIKELFNISIRRRYLLQMFGASFAAGVLWKPELVWSAADPFAGFMEISRFLTGDVPLDEELGKDIYFTLCAYDKDFPKKVKLLGQYVDGKSVESSKLYHPINAGAAEAAAQIGKAWYLGVMGNGARATVITYEGALMFNNVKDISTIPSYASGNYISWSQAPISAAK